MNGEARALVFDINTREQVRQRRQDRLQVAERLPGDAGGGRAAAFLPPEKPEKPDARHPDEFAEHGVSPPAHNGDMNPRVFGKADKDSTCPSAQFHIFRRFAKVRECPVEIKEKVYPPGRADFLFYRVPAIK